MPLTPPIASLPPLVGLSFLLAAVIVSAIFYQHRGQAYAAGKSRASHGSVRSFRWVYGYLRLTTLVMGAGSFVADHPLLLDVHDDLRLELTGLLLASLGLGLFVVAKISLGVAYSPCFDAFVPQAIVRTGPYRWIRHPIYTGNMLLLVGLGTLTGSLWLLGNALLLAAYCWRSAVGEERTLAAAFPLYRDYLAETGRFLPRISRAAARRVVAPAG